MYNVYVYVYVRQGNELLYMDDDVRWFAIPQRCPAPHRAQSSLLGSCPLTRCTPPWCGVCNLGRRRKTQKTVAQTLEKSSKDEANSQEMGLGLVGI